MHIRQGFTSLLSLLVISLLSTGRLAMGARLTAPPAETVNDQAAPAEPAALFYLPLVRSDRFVPRVNAPHFAAANVFPDRYDETAIFWLGRVTPADNYADVRIGYSDTALELRLAIVDRLLWHDLSPSAGDLEAWDAVTVYLNRDGNAGSAPVAGAYRFVAQLGWSAADRSSRQAAYQGNGTTWVPASVPFTTTSSWRGDALNNLTEDRGWEAGLRIPFASLGLSGAPAPGTLWGLGIAVFDRDDNAGTALATQTWPEMLNPSRPATWGQLHFGPPTFTAPPAANAQTLLIRDGLAGADVPDAAVGGTLENLCPGGSDHLWNEWGNRNFGLSSGANIQNQRDIADWPCFAKYYLRFPLNGIPWGKTIVSATLTLHHWGNSGDVIPGQWNSAQASFMHVLTVPSTWAEATLTWNNAPQAIENVSQAWVPVAVGCTAPCLPRTWDVSYAVSKAYAAGGPISFALYASDSAYDSGKFFSTSEVAGWQAVGRPTLTVVWGDP